MVAGKEMTSTEVQNQKPQTRNQKSKAEIRSQKLKTRNQKSKPEIRSQKFTTPAFHLIQICSKIEKC
jgi:hypothetical protein